MISCEDFSKLDLRVAEILEVREHKNADKLLILKIRIGEKEKQIVAGIKNHYKEEDLTGKKIIIVNNLEPVKLRGEESEGMLLAVTDKENVVLLTVDKDCSSGSKIK